MSKISKTNLAPISGFPEFLPQEQIVFNKVIAVIREFYERAGAVPIETPAVERVEVLRAKGGIDKEIYKISRLQAAEGDDDEKDLAFRFDLTVPLARYVAQHRNELAFPFRRYQIQPVWRGERAQAGRYRQFYQCDIDVIGEDELSLLHDAEMPFIIYKIFSKLNIGPFFIRVNNRKILQGFFASQGVEPENISKALGAIDEIEKVGLAQVSDQLNTLNLETKIDSIMAFFAPHGSIQETISYLTSLSINEEFERGVNELTEVVRGIEMLGVPTSHFGIDLSVARGLDYYRGTVYETRLVGNSGIGSICSGGRYDELASLYAHKKYPGVGISIGITRLLPKLFQLKILEASRQTVADVLVVNVESAQKLEYLRLGGELRDAGINTEVYLEDKKLANQMKYANKKGFRFVVFAGPDELIKGMVIVRNMKSGEQEELKRDNLAQALVSRLIEI